MMLGEIRMFPFMSIRNNEAFAKCGWLCCNGQQMPIKYYMPLFSVIGTTYGGDGTNYFYLPDLREHMPLNAGTGAQLSAYKPGDKGGNTDIKLEASHLPAHHHSLLVSLSKTAHTDKAPKERMQEALLGRIYNLEGAEVNAYTPRGEHTLNPLTVSNTGEKIPMPHNNMPPFAKVQFMIACQGEYPYWVR